MNQKEFAEKYKVRPQTVKTWYEKGYLPHAIIDEKTGVYDIPADTPRPFKNHSNVVNHSALVYEFLQAAELNQSIFPQMYPKISETIFNDRLTELINDNIIRVNTTVSGDEYLDITTLGISYKATLESAKASTKKSLDGKISLGLTFIQAAAAVWPYVPALIQTVQNIK